MTTENVTIRVWMTHIIRLVLVKSIHQGRWEIISVDARSCLQIFGVFCTRQLGMKASFTASAVVFGRGHLLQISFRQTETEEVDQVLFISTIYSRRGQAQMTFSCLSTMNFLFCIFTLVKLTEWSYRLELFTKICCSIGLRFNTRLKCEVCNVQQIQTL